MVPEQTNVYILKKSTTEPYVPCIPHKGNLRRNDKAKYKSQGSNAEKYKMIFWNKALRV